jgi:hypothetical protein
MTGGLFKAKDLGNLTAGGLYVNGGISVREIGGRDGIDTLEGGDSSRRFLVTGSSDPLACRAKVLLYPSIKTYDGMNIVSLERDNFGPAEWTFTANYSRTAPAVATTGGSPGYTVTIDTTGASILQTVSYAQSRYAISGKTAPDYKKSIDVQDGIAQGVERVIEVLKITVRARIATEYIISPIKYARLIASLTGTTNNATMFGEFTAGEILFAGATGDIVAEEPTLAFTFLASKNVTGLEIGGITGIAKKGHEYLWCLFDTAKDATTGMLIRQPRAVYVDQIYGSGNHSLLSIGLAPT